MSEIPSAGWSGWGERAASLRAFLATPRGRSWSEITSWASEERINGVELLNRLAALEGLGAVFSTGEGKAVRWVALREGQQRPLDVVITSAPELVPQGRRRGRERPEERRYSLSLK